LALAAVGKRADTQATLENEDFCLTNPITSKTPEFPGSLNFDEDGFRLWSLSTFFEIFEQRVAVSVFDVEDFPRAVLSDERVNDSFLGARIGKGNGNHRFVVVNFRLPDRHIFNIRVLRVVENVEINHADFVSVRR
jgi:hypothetical protein